ERDCRRTPLRTERRQSRQRRGPRGGAGEALMTDGDSVQARARRAGLLFFAVEVCYVASLIASTSGPNVLHRPAVALQVVASAATIAVAWAFFELLKHVN